MEVDVLNTRFWLASLAMLIRCGPQAKFRWEREKAIVLGERVVRDKRSLVTRDAAAMQICSYVGCVGCALLWIGIRLNGYNSVVGYYLTDSMHMSAV